MTLRMIDTFSGIGGFSLAARWLGGIETVQFVERDPYCQQVLAKHWPIVPIHDDICTFQPEPGSADIICGGFPCQDISQAGKGAGLAGSRSGLFYELLRVVRLVGPRYIVLENVAAITYRGMDDVLGALAEAGYDAEWACIPAAAVGACHQRDRWWCVAYSNVRDGQSGLLARSAVHEQAAGQGADGDAGSADEVSANVAYSAKSPSNGSPIRSAANSETNQQRQRAELGGSDSVDAANATGQRRREAGQLRPSQPTERAPSSGKAIANSSSPRLERRWPSGSTTNRLSSNWRSYLSEPVLCRGDDGLSCRVDRLKALGNAVVPQVAMVPLARVLELADYQ